MARFPDDVMFQLTQEDFQILKSQSAISSSGWGGRRKPLFVYTEFGALKAANILRSEQAVRMSVFIVRAFLYLREIAKSNNEISRKIEKLEKRIGDYDQVRST